VYANYHLDLANDFRVGNVAAKIQGNGMKVFVTGGAGFIGSTLVDRLLAAGNEVVAFDNLSTGFTQFLDNARKYPSFRFVQGDILSSDSLRESMSGCDMVFHLAANADVRHGLKQPERDLQQNTIGTFNVLEAMRLSGCKQISFSSTGSIYGDANIVPTPEDAPFPIQTSLYGASKLAGEGLIQAYCEGYGFRGWIFRFVSVLGERYTHGHIFDFFKKMLTSPERLDILGNGRQRKSYMYVQDTIDAMLIAIEKCDAPVNVFNLGTDEYVEVNDSIDRICSVLRLQPERVYSGGDRGWIGDSPFIYLDTQKIRSLGWKPKWGILDSVEHTLIWLSENRWVLEARQ